MAASTRDLTDERRARLLAERRLETRRGEMQKDVNEKERHVAGLTEAILEKRRQLDRLQADLERARVETRAIQDRLKDAEGARQVSESRLWHALETVRDGFAMYDSDARLTCANRAFLSIFDGLEEVVPGIHYNRLCEILLEEGIVDPGMPKTDWLARMAGRFTHDRIPDQTLILWDGQFVKLSDRRLEGGGIVSLGQNQTYERRITSAIETISDGFVIFDRDDKLVMCNQRYRDLLPGSGDLIRPGVSFYDILQAAARCGGYPDAIGQEDAWIEQRMQMHQSPPAQPFEQRMDGDRWVRVVEAATPDGGRAGLRADVSDSKKLEGELRDARQEAEAASRAKSQFLTNMNHELRTPLNGIIGLTSILAEDAETAGNQRLIGTVGRSAEALLRIIEDVLDTVSYENRYAVADVSAFDLTFTIERVIALLSPKMHLSRTETTVRFAPHLPTRFLGDGPRLRQVLATLLGNAVKFGAGQPVTLSVDGTRSEDTGEALWDLILTVEDGGPGIPDDASERIFLPFTQAEGTHRRAHDGMGLGLSLCRSVVDLLGGRVWHDKSHTDGARFQVAVSLPEDPHGRCAVAANLTSALIRTDDLKGAMLQNRLAALGLNPVLLADGADLTANYDVVVVQAGAVSGDDGDRMRAIANLTEATVIVYGTSDAPFAELGERCINVGDTPEAWPAMVDAVCRNPPGRKVPATEGSDFRMNVLAAEDNRTNQLVLRKMLEPFAIDLTIVSSGQDVIAAAERLGPDLIFMDISMPGMDGKEATARIRDAERLNGYPPVTIVALTAHALEQDRRDILAAGLDDVLVKPLDRQALTEAIEKARKTVQSVAVTTSADRTVSSS